MEIINSYFALIHPIRFFSIEIEEYSFHMGLKGEEFFKRRGACSKHYVVKCAFAGLIYFGKKKNTFSLTSLWICYKKSML